MITKNQIEELRTLLEKASPGPWNADIDDPETENPMWTGKFYTDAHRGTWCTYGADETEVQHVHNARLVAASVTLLPSLLDNIEKLSESLKQAVDVIEEQKNAFE